MNEAGGRHSTLITSQETCRVEIVMIDIDSMLKNHGFFLTLAPVPAFFQT